MRLLIGSVVLTLGVGSCGHHEQPFTARATVACLRDHAQALLRPTRATAHGVDISGFGRDPDGTVQVVLYPSEDVAYLRFTPSGHAPPELAGGPVYRRRNVVVSWDPSGVASSAERRAVDRCLRSKPPPGLPAYRAAEQPRRFAGSPSPADLVPGDAVAKQAWRFGRRIALWWQRESFVGSDLDTGGIVIWQPAWRLAYSLPFAANAVFRVQARHGDINGDGKPDLLLFEDMGGSAGCGIHRLLASVGAGVRQLYATSDCEDNARLEIAHGALVVYTGLVRDPRSGSQIHCCWKTWLRTTIRWRGTKRISTERAYVTRVPS